MSSPSNPPPAVARVQPMPSRQSRHGTRQRVKVIALRDDTLYGLMGGFEARATVAMLAGNKGDAWT